MLKLALSISEKGQDRIVHVPFDPEDTIETFIDRINETAAMDGHAILELALENAVPDDISTRLKDTLLRHRDLKLHRVCVNVHFESESVRHWFPVGARWALVHRWACRHFQVAKDACANLELRESTANGPPINERQKIGNSEECCEVWLVKPGSEQNG